MEIEARLFERKVQKFQKRTDFTFRIFQQLFVDNAIYRAWLDSIEMRHQTHIIRIILPQMGKVIAKRLPLGEMLPVIGETAIQRMPPRVDNLGVGKNEADEDEIIPVIGQLIDKKWLVRFALNARAFHELCAKPF